jgi:hypothetical protein
MCYHDIYSLSAHRMSNRTGLYAESHGIVANVSYRRVVLTRRLTRCAEFLGCRDRLRVSLQQRHVLLATSLVARRTGAAVAILSVTFALVHACDRCGKRLGGQDSLLPILCGQCHRYFFYVVPRVLSGRDLLKLFPELRLHISSLSRYVRSLLPPYVFNDFV